MKIKNLWNHQPEYYIPIEPTLTHILEDLTHKIEGQLPQNKGVGLGSRYIISFQIP